MMTNFYTMILKRSGFTRSTNSENLIILILMVTLSALEKKLNVCVLK